MAVRTGEELGLTICIPQIGRYVNNAKEYKNNLEIIEQEIHSFVENKDLRYKFNLSMNTRDDFNTLELYLTAIGSSIESGDEGLVGRGNRVNGLISSTRPYTMEGLNGKNPVYHTGKLYYVISRSIADEIYNQTGHANQVFLISQSGRPIKDPWKVIISVNGTNFSKNEVEEIYNQQITDVERFTKELLSGKHELC